MLFGLTEREGLYQFSFFVREHFHRHRIGRASYSTQTAADTCLVVLQHRGRRLKRIDLIMVEQRLLGLIIHIQLFERHELQTILGTNVHAAVAHDALLCIIDGLNVASQTAFCLGASLCFGITTFDLRNARATLKIDRRRRLSRQLLVLFRTGEPSRRNLFDREVIEGVRCNTTKVLIDGKCGALPVRNCVDDVAGDRTPHRRRQTPPLPS